ncbi:MAG: uracil-xanthine permease [Clostridia bacterium]|nr:uracil-xanthine permease [Clostridia bacterium]
MKLVFQPHEKPSFGANIVFAIQQLLAIMAATLVVPVIINSSTGSNMSPAAALFGAGIGTFVYLLFTKFRSPVFLGSSFAFIGSMCAAFAGGVSMSLGFVGMILGAIFAGLVYVAIAVIVKFAGVNWINKLMPAAVIGPTVAIIGLSLAGNAIGDLQKAPAGGHTLIAVLCGLVTLFVTIIASTFGKKMAKMIPFIIGILAGYAVGSIFTVIGNLAGIDALKVIDYSALAALVDGGITLNTFVQFPDFTFLTAIKGIGEINASYVATIAVAYIPVAFVVFAEHIADHKNISSIIEKDLLEDPGLHRTLLGDGVGSMAGAFFGGCPNTTYGESVACVAISGNASVSTIFTTAVLAILISFLSPFVAFVNTIPSCVMGGVCVALYGFIAVSGLKMVQKVDLEQNKNLFVVSTILICGIGGLTLTFGKVTLTSIACALILGIIVNLILGKKADE